MSAVLDFDDRIGFSRRLGSILGAYVDPYDAALVNHRPDSERLPPELQRLYDELVARSSSPSF